MNKLHRLFFSLFDFIAIFHQDKPINNCLKSYQMNLQMKGHYPYGQCSDPKLDCKDVKVHEQIQLVDSKCLNFQQKIQALQDKRFGKSCMTQFIEVKIDSNQLNIYYQYIPIQLGQWVANMSKNLLLEFRDRLLNFASLVAQKNIKTEFKFTRLGLTNDQQISYFLGFDFKINPQLSPDKLKFHYWNQITQFFDPFIYEEQIKMRSSADSDNLIFSSEGLQKINLDSINIKKDPKLQSSMDLAGQQRIINQFKHHKQHNNFEAHSSRSGHAKKKDYELEFQQLLSLNGPATCTSQDGMKKNLKKMNFIQEAASHNTPFEHSKQQYSKIVNSTKKGNYISQFEQLLGGDIVTPGCEIPTNDISSTKSSTSIQQKLRQSSSNQQLKDKANNSIQNSMKLLQKLRNKVK